MRVQVAASGPGGGMPLCTLIIDDELAIDAGALGWADEPSRLAGITDILLTHTHIDHIAGLPVFLDTVYGLAKQPPVVHGTAVTLQAVQDHIFNDRIMPDFVGMSRTMNPFLRLQPVTPGKIFTVGRYQVLALEVDHVVPTVAYLVDDGKTAIAVVTDTAPVPDVLDQIAAWPRMRTLFLEASFPDSMDWLAVVSKHHTVRQFVEQASRLPPTLDIYAIHVKPRWVDEIAEAIRQAGRSNICMAEPGQVLTIPSSS